MEAKVGVSSTVETTSGLGRKLSVTVAPDRVEDGMKKAFSALNRKIRLKGFRQGKVPRAVLEREYGSDVARDVVSELVEETCGEVIEANRLDVVVAPRLLKQELQPDKTLVYEAEVEIRPEFALASYTGIEVERRIVRVEDDHIARALERLREQMSVLEADEDRINVEPGDIVVFDMYGFSGGEAVPGTSGRDIQLEVGSGRFPDEFEKQLVGVTRSIKTPITVPFAEDHQDQQLAGKTVRFDVTVKEIKRKVVPDLSDDFVKDLGWEGCDSLDDLRAKVRSDLEKRARSDADRAARGLLIDELVTANPFESPSALVDQTISRLAHDMGLHEVPEDKVEELREALKPRAVRQVAAGFILDAIAKAEEVEVSKEELEQVLRQQVMQAGDKADEVRKHYSRPAALIELHTGLVREKALEKAVELTTQRDVEVDESQVADRG